ncbi:MAG: helix-turn-helix domain-containing protein [Burkholderiaceae bacterium]
MVKKTSETGLLIGEVARRSGVHIETIRYYERAGVVPKPGRTEGGQRQYSADQLNRLIFVRRSRELGFSLDEVRAMVELVDNDKITCGQIHELTIRHLKSVREKLADLKKMERALKTMAGQCSQGDAPDCAIIDTLYSAT